MLQLQLIPELAFPIEQIGEDGVAIFTVLCLGWVALGSRRELSRRTFEPELLWGARNSGSSSFRNPQPPNPSTNGSAGPEVPRTLMEGTLGAKLEATERLPQDGFNPKE